MIKLPDLDDMSKVIDEINSISIERSRLDIELKLAEIEINKIVSENEKYYVNNKVPSQTYIDNTWKFSGLTGELIEKRQRYSDLTNQLDYAKMRYEFLRMIVELYRTQEANKRASVSTW